MVERLRLGDTEIAARLQKLKGWSVVDGKLHKQFTFKDFVEAFGFMSKGALIAEAMNHHPDWSNVYNRVTVNLSTHDIGGISAVDFSLAEKFDSMTR